RSKLIVRLPVSGFATAAVTIGIAATLASASAALRWLFSVVVLSRNRPGTKWTYSSIELPENHFCSNTTTLFHHDDLPVIGLGDSTSFSSNQGSALRRSRARACCKA